MSYSLITGASSGIGWELARLFAKQSHNVILISRREDRLRKLAGELEREFQVKTLVVPKDLAEPQAASEVHNLVTEKGVTVEHLVNNAGFMVYGEFSRTDWDQELSMIYLHVVTLTQLMKLFLRDMLVRGSGKVLNIASTGSFVPGPLNAVYCATKAYMLSLSEATAEEVRGTGVTITTLCPGGTRTEFGKKARMKTEPSSMFNVMEPGEVARVGYRALMKGDRLVVPGFQNKFQVLASRFLPGTIVTKLLRSMMSRYS